MHLLALALSFLITSTAVATAACEGRDLRPGLDPELKAEIAAQVDQAPFANGNFWRAQKAGKTIYVLGTIHLGDARLDARVRALEPVIATSDLVMLEGTSAEQARIQSTPEVILLPESRTVPSLLTDKQWQAVSGALRERGFPAVMAARMQPFFLAAILSMPPCAAGALALQDGVDAQVEQMAEAAGVPTGSLESVDELMTMIQGFPMDLQIKMLLSSLHQPETATDLLETMMAAYLEEATMEAWTVVNRLSADAALTGVGDMTDVATEIERKLLDSRNQTWMPRILKAEGGPQIFVAVGAAHLPGENGVLNLLAEAGFTLTRQPF